MSESSVGSNPTLSAEVMKRVLVFDVNETLLDLGALDPHFQRVFGDAQVRVEWFQTMLQSAFLTTITGPYKPFGDHFRAALAITALFSFMTAWSEFLIARVVISKQALYTLPLGLESGSSVETIFHTTPRACASLRPLSSHSRCSAPRIVLAFPSSRRRSPLRSRTSSDLPGPSGRMLSSR